MEKIIFCVDLSNEVESLDFCRGLKKTHPTRLDLIKTALKLFINTKQKMNPEHEFGICVLTSTATWYQDLTTDIEALTKKISHLQPQGDFPTFDISSLFELLNTKFPDIVLSSHTRTTCEHVYRVIFIYCRSATLPTGFPSNISLKILDCPLFFFDALYLHSKPSKDNKPQDVYDFITEIEGKDHHAYYFENSTSIRKFHLHAAHLLAHPLQRPEQSAFKTVLINEL